MILVFRRMLAYPVGLYYILRMSDYYTPQELAGLLKVSVHTLASWRRSTRHARAYGPSWVEVGGLIRYPKQSLDEWLASRTKNGDAV